jgi:hypothetical protein
MTGTSRSSTPARRPWSGSGNTPSKAELTGPSSQARLKVDILTLFTRVRGRVILRSPTSALQSSEKFDEIIREMPSMGMRRARTPGIMVTVTTEHER